MPATSEIYTLSLHDALPIFREGLAKFAGVGRRFDIKGVVNDITVVDDYGHHPAEIRATLEAARGCKRSEEHTSELQSLRHLVCRLLLEKKKQNKTQITQRKA